MNTTAESIIVTFSVEWQADELGDPILEDEMAEIVRSLRMAG